MSKSPERRGRERTKAKGGGRRESVSRDRPAKSRLARRRKGGRKPKGRFPDYDPKDFGDDVHDEAEKSSDDGSQPASKDFPTPMADLGPRVVCGDPYDFEDDGDGDDEGEGPTNPAYIDAGRKGRRRNQPPPGHSAQRDGRGTAKRKSSSVQVLGAAAPFPQLAPFPQPAKAHKAPEKVHAHDLLLEQTADAEGRPRTKALGQTLPFPVASVLDLNLGLQLKDSLRMNGFEELTPLQQDLLPAALEGQDVLVCSGPASGKSTALLIPLLQGLLDAPPPDVEPSLADFWAPVAKGGASGAGPEEVVALRPLALVLTGSEEAALGLSFRAWALAGAEVSGVASVHTPKGGLADTVGQHCRILVGTPAALLGPVLEGEISVRGLEHVVVMDAGAVVRGNFGSHLECLVELLPSKRRRQTLVSVAADRLPPNLRHMARSLLGLDPWAGLRAGTAEERAGTESTGSHASAHASPNPTLSHHHQVTVLEEAGGGRSPSWHGEERKRQHAKPSPTA